MAVVAAVVAAGDAAVAVVFCVVFRFLPTRKELTPKSSQRRQAL